MFLELRPTQPRIVTHVLIEGEMGYSRWSDVAYTSYADTTNYRSAKTVSAVFSNTSAPPDGFQVKNIVLRESRDSELNPNSTPIILGLDVTGSMGVYAAKIAQEHLPNLMSNVINESVIPDPHLLIMGIGDPRANDRYPAQASQFESDLRIIEQTRELFIEGRGGGNSHEGYDLAWYFAKYCTSTDANNRGSKGVIFTFGDEPIAPRPLTHEEWVKVFGGREYPEYNSMQELYSTVSEDWEIFHVIIEEGSFFQASPHEVRKSWAKVLPNTRILNCNDSSQIGKICAMALRILQIPKDLPLPGELYEDEALSYAFHGILNA